MLERAEIGSVETETPQRQIARTSPTKWQPGILLLALPALIYLLLTYVLPPPLPILPEHYLLDPSWQLVLTDAFLRGAQFGRDIVYTYGPWGFLEIARGDPRIYPWLFCGRLVIALAFVFGTASIAVRRIRHPLGQHLFIAAVALLSDPVGVLPMALLAILLSSKSRPARITPIVHLLAIACALTMWIKFTGFVAVGLLATAIAAQDLIKRRLPLISLEIVTASFVFWLLARQSLSTLPSYVQGAFSLARSYGPEMFVPGPGWELAFVAILIVAMAFPTGLVFFSRRTWSIWPSMVWLVLLVFVQAKEALVRHDSFHIWMGIVNSLLPCTLMLFCATGLFNSEWLPDGRLRFPLRLCVAWVLVVSVAFPVIQLGTPAGLERLQILAANADGVRSLFEGQSLSARYLQQLAEFHRVKPLARVAGTVDFFPDNAAMLYGNSLTALLPPVPQAFAAYNSHLSGKNASFFRSAGRPHFVFFDIAPIDNRYPSSSDPLSLMALMDCYEPSGYPGRYLLLRATGCEAATMELVSDTKTRAGQTVAMPSGGDDVIWARIDTRLNRTGSIVEALARSPSTGLTVDTGMGRRTFRISPEAARMGFLLSPLILDPAAFGRLVAGGPVDSQTKVRALMMIQSELAQRLSDPVIGIRLYKVHLRQRHDRR